DEPGRAMARAAAEPGRRLGGDRGLLRPAGAGGSGRVDPVPDVVGASRPSRRGTSQERGRRRRPRPPSPNTDRPRNVGRRAVERHRLPAGLLSPLPPVPQILSSLGAWGLSLRLPAGAEHLIGGAPRTICLPVAVGALRRGSISFIRVKASSHTPVMSLLA